MRLFIVDISLADYPKILNKLPEDGQFVLLSPDQEPLAQINSAIDPLSLYHEIHLFSHGEPGALLLGKTRIDTDHLLEQRADWQAYIKAKNKLGLGFKKSV